MNMKLGPNRDAEITELEQARLSMLPPACHAGAADLGSEL